MTQEQREQRAELVDREHAVDGNWLWLLLECSSSLPEHAVFVGNRVIEDRVLTSEHELTLERDLWTTRTQSLRLAPDNPFLSERQRQSLDASGLIREGTVVKADDVLASILAVVTSLWGQPKPQPGMERVRDDSLTVPDGWTDARIVRVEQLSRRQLGRPIPRGLIGKVRITLRLEHDLSVGDLLLAEQGCLGVVAGFGQGSVDVQVGVAVGKRLGIAPGQVQRIKVAKGESLARWSVRARGTGPYSLITQKPLNRYAEKISEQQVGWLRANGFAANAAELLALKGSDVGNRLRTALAARGEGPLPVPAAPETLWTLKAYLLAAGIDVQLMSRGTHVALVLRPMSDAERLACSSGEVRKPETINYRTYIPEKDGLMCERIFGMEDSAERRRRFGHVSLPVPIVPILWRTGSPSLLERLLILSREQIESIVQCEAEVLKGPDSIRIAPLDNFSPSPPQANETSIGTGATAIQALLAGLSDADIPPVLRGRIDSLIMQKMLMYPPELRPLVLLENDNFATADTNDLYRQLVNRANRLRKLTELNAPAALLIAEQQELQRCADRLMGNTLLPEDQAQRREASNDRLCDVLRLLGQSILDAASTTVDYAGSARAVADTQLPREWMLVPEKIWRELGLERAPAALVTRVGDPMGGFIALRARPHNQDVIRLPSIGFESLGCAADVVPVCIVHRPLGEAACAEAERSLGQVLPDRCAPNRILSPAWMQATELEEVLRGIAEAALSGQPVELDSPRSLMLAGPGPVEWSAVSESLLPSKDEVREVPCPPEVSRSILSGPDVQTRMLEVVRSQRRCAIVFELRPMPGTPVPEDGNLGAGPWLPRDFRWPISFGRKVPFLAQVPLDAARNAGVLPIDVPSRSLLTIFWEQSWSEAGPADAPLYQMVTIDESLVQWDADGTPCVDASPQGRSVLTPRLVEEYPSWTEMEAMFDAEIGAIDPKDIKAFHRDQWPQFAAAQAGLKLGGWAAWVQGADSPDPLILQVASDEDADIMFGDMGSLYLTQVPSGGMWFLMQCY